MPFKPHTSIVRPYSEHHKPPTSAAQLGKCLGEAREHTHIWNRNTQNPQPIFPASSNSTCFIASSIHPMWQTCNVFYNHLILILKTLFEALYSSLYNTGLKEHNCNKQQQQQSPVFILYLLLSTCNIISLIPAVTVRDRGRRLCNMSGAGISPKGQGEERSWPGKQVCKVLMKMSASWTTSHLNYPVSSSPNLTSIS